jgi:hypothetical protein
MTTVKTTTIESLVGPVFPGRGQDCNKEKEVKMREREKKNAVLK